MDGFICLTTERRMKVKKGLLEFTTNLMDRSKLVDSDIGLEEKKEHAISILEKAWNMVKTRRQMFVEPERKGRLEGYISKTEESLKTLIGVGYNNENEAENYKSLSNNSVRVDDLLREWDFSNEEFKKMVDKYRNDGMSVTVANQIVLQIDCLFGNKKK